MVNTAGYLRAHVELYTGIMWFTCVPRVLPYLAWSCITSCTSSTYVKSTTHLLIHVIDSKISYRLPGMILVQLNSVLQTAARTDVELRA